MNRNTNLHKVHQEEWTAKAVWVRRIRWVVLAISATILTACGGGGDGSTSANTNQSSTSTGDFQTRADVQLVSAADSANITSIGTSNQAGVSVVTLSSNASTTLKGAQVGQKILIPPSTSAPLGMAVVVNSSTVNAQGQTELSVKPAELMEVAQQIDVKLDDVPLAAENFVGAIAPSAIGGNGQLSAVQAGLLSKQVTALNGALKLTPSKMSTADRLMTGVLEAKVAQDGTITLTPEPIKLSKFMADDDIEPSKMQPFGKNTELELSLSVTIKDLKLTSPAIGTNSTTLDHLNYVVTGKMSTEAKLSGGQTITLGAFNRAWKDVEESGKAIKVIGLSSDDKIGKIPLVGLVFSVKCPPSKPCVYGGNTQTPIREAQAGGVIFWVMLNAKGELSLDGAAGVRSNIDFEMGAQKDSNGELDGVANFKKPAAAGSSNFLELPFIEGELKGAAQIGISAEMDAFALGVRFLNASAAGLYRPDFSVKAEPALAWTLPSPGEGFRWTGNACLTSKVGGGVLASFAVKAGAEVNVKSKWLKKLNGLGGSVEYAYQYPSEEDMALVGWHGGWYTANPVSVCLPQPVLASAVVDRLPSGNWRWQVTGSHLPTDLALMVYSTQLVCVGLPTLTETPSIGNNFTKAVFECQPLSSTPVADFTYGFSSATASNLDTTTISGQWNSATAQITTSGSSWTIGQTFSVWLTNAADAIKGVIFDIGDGIAAQFKVVSGKVSAVADFVGGWVTPGDKTVTATYKDANGNTIGSSILKLTASLGNVSQTAFITDVVNDSVTPSVSVAGGASTTDTTPIIRGALSTTLGACGTVTNCYTVQMFDDGVSLGAATVAADGTWEYTKTFATGSHSLTAAVVRWDGVTGSHSAVRSFTITGATSTSRLPHSGITASQCYAAGSDTLVECNLQTVLATNGQQDGHRASINAMSYSLVPNVSGIAGLNYSKNECVKDDVTGLVWEGKTATNDFRDYRKTYTNYGDNRSGDASAYVTAVNESWLCGKNDWRLPTVDELQTLVDYSKPPPGPTINTMWFPNTQRDSYLSLSPHVSYFDIAWGVGFYDGSDTFMTLIAYGHVRLVRATW